MSAAHSIQGTRHIRNDGRECLCGCQRVTGLTGEVIESAMVDGEQLEIVRFMVPSPAGGPDKPLTIAYFDGEYRFPVAS